jgi:antirestriction protein ArdC
MKKELAQEITDQFIAQLKEDKVPWRRPWSLSGFAPHNFTSKRPYRGINLLILGLQGYGSPAWLTYKAAEAAGGQVRKGEKSTKILFWKPMTKEDKDTGEDKSFVLARMYSVFNTEQIDGLEWTPPDMSDPVPVPDQLKTLVENYQDAPTFEWTASDKAYYRPSTDSITMPLLEQFNTVEGYGETLTHEMIHSTGHPKRLNRFELTQNVSRETYSFEELVAEIGASMLMQQVGIMPDMPQMASYVASWLKVLQDDEGMIIKAAQKAQKAVDHIMGTKYETSEND